MEEAFEIEFRKKSREVRSSPKKRRREKGAADYDREKVSEQFGGVWRLQSKRADEDSWTYHDRPLPADLLVLKEIIEKKYRRRRATVEELLSLREMVREIQ